MARPAVTTLVVVVLVVGVCAAVPLAGEQTGGSRTRS